MTSCGFTVSALVLSVSLSESQTQRLITGLDHLKEVLHLAMETQAVLMVDAEYTNINPALSVLTKASALLSNKTKPHVWNTYQCYLKVSRSSTFSRHLAALFNRLSISPRLVGGV